MTTKETAIETLTEFFTHIGGRQPLIGDAWDEYDHISARKNIGTKSYTVTALVDDESLDTVSVVVYDFRKKAKRVTVFRVTSLPVMAAKFTLEAIDAYEAEMEDAA